MDLIIDGAWKLLKTTQASHVEKQSKPKETNYSFGST